ncbi:tyrosine-type recombinase/integrase [Streptomyces viridochromogenes]|uniref:tyrosine-type recombinase/integrase n=2 Tax=Streptomyces TaxID=1883 RepID=UPI000B269FE7|nr:site-specific integrase [Streptomyces viridochromogenes]
MANTSTVETYTIRDRRRNYRGGERQDVTRFVSTVVKPAPAPRPQNPPAPFGDLSCATVPNLLALATEILRDASEGTREKRRAGIHMLFDHLATHPGKTWQERWEAAGFNTEDAPPVSILSATRSQASSVTTALKMAFGLRIIQPSLSGFRVNRFSGYAEPFRLLQDDPALDEFFKVIDAHTRLNSVHKHRAKFDITCALTTQGIALEHVTPSALLHYSLENKRLGLTHGACNKDETRFAARAAWEVLLEMGHFPQGTPHTVRACFQQGQHSVEGLVDRYKIENAAVRQLLIDYLARRKADTDYTTLDGLGRHLAANFWAVIERIAPGQKDLRLSSEVYEQWLAEIQFWRGDRSKIRQDRASILLAVRGFYIDLQSWSVGEPEQWAQWVVPCPIRPRDLKGFRQRRREIHRRMADRTRLRQPLLPVLVQHVESRHEHFADLREAARSTPLGAQFTHRGHHYRRSNSPEDRRRIKTPEGPTIRVIDEETGKMIHLDRAEEMAFWDWAVIEVLRHSGIRIEELTELTHMSIRQYQRPNGEIIALLVVAPSKNERERVIPMSPELFHAIAQVVRRQTKDGRPIPLLSRYDPQERTWSEPMPFLFQRQIGTVHSVLAPNTVVRMLSRRCEEIAQTNKAFEDATFTPHDFRRLFATEVVNGGLPVHIGAALLGHMNLQTTQGYVAVFAEDIVGHYQKFLDHRRSQRPEDEYTDVTPQEWAEFEEHFDKRKVDLGNCARPYGTPCQHEHACIRCPMLQINPKMLPRLDELEKDLVMRRKRAEEEQWLGEIEGIDLTLTFLRTKQADAIRSRRRTTVDLEFPRPRG